MCVDLDGDAAEKLAAELGDAAAAAADVREADDMARVAADAVQRLGRIDILVNSAGVFPPTPLLEMAPAQWDTVLDINTKGTFLAAQACAPKMHDTAGGGAIVNIASKSAYQPTRGLAHYAASKGGIVMLTKALALELSPLHIRVNAVAPGGVDTPGAARTAGALRSPGAATADFGARCPMGRS